MQMTTYFKQNFTVDDNLALKASGAITASAAVATVLDLGDGFAEGEIIIDVSAIDIVGNDEIYDIVAQVTNVAAFATDTAIVDRCSMTLAAAEVQRTDANGDAPTGRFVLPFNNQYNGTIYRYLRLYTVVAGATGSITYSARLAKRLG